jgi:hypothetical protein
MSNNMNIPTLPANFTPGEHDIVIGKGKKFYFHAGNQWLRTVVAGQIDEYSQAMTKADKSNIISSVVEFVRTNGRFVKLDTSSGQWVFAEPLLCREKCSQTFRDNLAQTYRSSNVAKRNKRRQEQQEKTDLVVNNMVLYPPAPQAKRMRTSYNTSTPTSVPRMAMNMPMEVPRASSPNSCATWFDWEMPLFEVGNSKLDLEPISFSTEASAFVTANDFEDGLFLDLTSNTSACVGDDFEPLPALSGSVKPVKPSSAPVEPSGFRLGDDFQRRTPAAFAA